VNILIVDDYPVSIRVLSHTLRKAGYTVHPAASAAEALDLFATTAFDLAILDIALPEMDGIELLKVIRREPRWRDLPVIMLTASGHDADRIAAKAAGVDAFLTKPTSSADLLDVVTRLTA
jgi:CheY-like chemotaxis protein